MNIRTYREAATCVQPLVSMLVILSTTPLWYTAADWTHIQALTSMVLSICDGRRDMNNNSTHRPGTSHHH